MKYKLLTLNTGECVRFLGVFLTSLNNLLRTAKKLLVFHSKSFGTVKIVAVFVSVRIAIIS